MPDAARTGGYSTGAGFSLAEKTSMEADIKELYTMVAAQKPTYGDKKFGKLSVEQKVLKMYEDVRLLAQEAGITLPS
jgi:hypothetical protein